jgi:hypothetical protein
MNTVKVKIDDVEVELKVVKPTSAQRAESEKIKSKKFRAAIENGDYLKGELKNILRKRGQWSDESETELKELEKKVDDGCRRLNEGGFELDEAKKLAYDISSWRIQMVNLLSVYADATDLTAEGQADNAAFDYLVSVCAVYNDSGKPFFESYDDYLSRKEEDYSFSIASKVNEVLNGGFDESVFASLPEYQFLKEYGFIDEKLRRIDEKGRLVDAQGRLIDEEGNLVNEEGKRIDRFGNVLDEDGKPIINRKPFLKNGAPVEK